MKCLEDCLWEAKQKIFAAQSAATAEHPRVRDIALDGLRRALFELEEVDRGLQAIRDARASLTNAPTNTEGRCADGPLPDAMWDCGLCGRWLMGGVAAHMCPHGEECSHAVRADGSITWGLPQCVRCR